MWHVKVYRRRQWLQGRTYGFPEMNYVARTKKRTCVVVAYKIGFRTGSKECSRALAANCTEIVILGFEQASE